YAASLTAILCLLFTFNVAVLQAQEAGTISGLVRAASSNETLTSATVRITETNQSAATDSDGSFTLRNLAAGRYTLRFSYLGLADETRTVELPGNSGVRIDVTLSSISTMEEVLVVGQRSAQASALNQQRAAFNISNVVSADDAGRFPDTNA